MKLAAIDIGSNSIHMIVVEVSPDGSFQVRDREKEMIGLGRGSLGRNRLEEDAIERGLGALRKYAKLATRHGVDELLAVATSAVRESLNGGDFIERVRRETGIQVSVITAIEEARLIALAVAEGIDLAGQRALVVDIGGGSIEMALFSKRGLVAAESFKLGVIRLAERFLDARARLSRTSAKDLTAYLRGVTSDFVKSARARGIDTLVGTSGTILTLGALAQGSRASDTPLNGQSVSRRRLAEVAARLAEMTGRERARLPGLDERRADTVLVGAVALVDLMERLGADEIVLCDRALREGIVADYLARNRARLDRMGEVPSLRKRSVLELAERYGYDARHARQVQGFALTIFDKTRALHGLGDAERRLLEHAALLHDIGTHIAFTNHHRHGYYLIKNAGLGGFRPEEIELVAGIVLYHRKGSPRRSDPCVKALDKPRREVLRKLAGILRLADGLDRSHFQVVRDLQIRVAGRDVSIRLAAGEDPELEIWAAARKGRLFEKALEARLLLVLKPDRDRPRMAVRPGRQEPELV